MAFFFSVFLQKAETATIVGYALSIWCSTIAGMLNVTIYALPNHMEYFFFLVPPFVFTRCIFYLSWNCAYEACYDSMVSLPTEFIACIVTLYLSSVVYLLLALYLQ